MGENEKLGFSFVVEPYDFSTFNRFFGATTPWVESKTSATIPWNGSQIPSDNDYLKVREVVAPKRVEVIPKEKFMQELGGKPHEVLINPVSEDTAQRLNKAFKDLRKTVGGFPFFTILSKRKARKHYKPKFTL